MIFGIDYLGGANYGNVIINEHPAGWAAGFILNTNEPSWPKRNAWPVIESLARTGRCPLIRVHAIWDDAHTYRPEYLPIINREQKKTIATARAFPNMRFEFSWMCENNMNSQQNGQMIETLNDPHITLVNSVFRGFPNAGAKLEIHGDRDGFQGPCNYSYDGTDCFQDNVAEQIHRRSNCDVFFFWSHRCNGHYGPKDKRPRDKRDAWPFENYLDAMIALSRDPGAVDLSNKYIYKAVAEDSGNGDWKDNKPCIIIPQRAKEVLFVCENGQVAGRAQYFGTFAGGGFRYYSREWGYQIAEKARRIQGHTLVSLTVDGKPIGKICPSHRAGSFR